MHTFNPARCGRFLLLREETMRGCHHWGDAWPAYRCVRAEDGASWLLRLEDEHGAELPRVQRCAARAARGSPAAGRLLMGATPFEGKSLIQLSATKAALFAPSKGSCPLYI